MPHTLHACFISYRHPMNKGGLEQKFIDDTRKALEYHLALYNHDHDVYFDEARLEPGYQYNERLSEAICRSACMVVVYWPSYATSNYCKKEILTMLNVEKRRQSILGDRLRGCRLFVPIILHGRRNELPEAVVGDTQCLNYSEQMKNPYFRLGAQREAFLKVARYMDELCQKMTASADLLFNDCDKFNFPDFSAAELDQLFPKVMQPFPGRGR